MRGQSLRHIYRQPLRRCHECNFPLSNKDLFCARCGANNGGKNLNVTLPHPVPPLKRRELYKLSASQSAT